MANFPLDQAHVAPLVLILMTIQCLPFASAGPSPLSSQPQSIIAARLVPASSASASSNRIGLSPHGNGPTMLVNYNSQHKPQMSSSSSSSSSSQMPANTNMMNPQQTLSQAANQQLTLVAPNVLSSNIQQATTSSSSSPISSLPSSQSISNSQQDFQRPQTSPSSSNAYTDAASEVLVHLIQDMSFRSFKFNEYFKELIGNSRRQLHTMFADTYGMMYEHNVEIFTNMFENLEQYYAKGQINLTESMKNFFERLYQKIFQVLNASKSFTPKYLECATEQLAHLKPFKDVPEKLIMEIRHVFVAARTFHQALNYGENVLRRISKLGFPQCISVVNEKLLKNGPNNRNPTQVRLPCLDTCEDVIRKCVGKVNLDTLNNGWREYVVALAGLATKLSTSYNIETVIQPMDVSISEAIMNFQENGPNITEQVMQRCGDTRPPIFLHPMSGSDGPAHIGPSRSRIHKRAVGARAPVISRGRGLQQNSLGFNQPLTSFTTSGSFKFANSDSHPSSGLFDHLLTANSKSPLIEEIRRAMLMTQNFWTLFPNSVCTSNQTSGKPLVGKRQQNCFNETTTLQDLNTDMRYQREIDDQVSKLIVMREKMMKALQGEEIRWTSEADLKPNTSKNQGPLRPSFITTSTTTTTPEPESDNEDSEEDVSEGSGDMENGELDSTDRIFSTTDPLLDYDTTDSQDDIEGSPSNPDTPTQLPAEEADQQHKESHATVTEVPNNSLDQPENMIQESWITAPSANGQKSGQMVSFGLTRS